MKGSADAEGLQGWGIPGLSYNEDAPRQEEIDFKSSLCQLVQLPEAPPCKGGMLAKRPSQEHSGGVHCSCSAEEQSQSRVQLGYAALGAVGTGHVLAPTAPTVTAPPAPPQLLLWL